MQQGCPAAPQVPDALQVPDVHVSPLLQWLSMQQGCPVAPQAPDMHIPAVQGTPPVHCPPMQQTCPIAPQLDTHIPAMHIARSAQVLPAQQG